MLKSQLALGVRTSEWMMDKRNEKLYLLNRWRSIRKILVMSELLDF